MSENQYLSRYFVCGCCDRNKAVTQAPETKQVNKSNGIYECVIDMPLCEPCANVFGWQVEPDQPATELFT